MNFRAEAPERDDAEMSEAVSALVRRARARRRTLDVPGFEEAVPLLREAIEAEPASAPAYAELALTYADWGWRRESACVGLRHELRAVEFQSLYNLAYDCAETAVRLAPESAAAHHAMAAALRSGAKADPGRRAREAELAVDLAPDDDEAVAELWRVRGYDPDDAAMRAVLEKRPELLALRLDLAESLCERGRCAEALSALETALRQYPTNVRVYYDIALLLDRRGLRAKALEILRKARALRPGDPLVKQGFWLLGEAV